MKNTLERAKFRILIYKGEEGYIGICYETGWVEEWNTEEEVKKHLIDGILALMKTIAGGHLSEKVINQKPPLKHRLFFFLFALASVFKAFDVTFFTEPILPLRFSNS